MIPMVRQMKDSGVEWMGEIPETWDILPAKRMFCNSGETKKADDVQLTASQQYGIISQNDYMALTGSRVVLATQDLEKWKHVEPQDFIISLRSFQGGLEMSKVSGCITWHYVVLRSCHKGINARFYKWLFKSSEYITALQRTCNYIRDGQDLRYSNFEQVPLFLPKEEEQENIANILDTKCAEIDKVVEQTRATIEEYKKLKQAIITEAVTKGVRGPRPMKPSGVEWIGDIPEEWGILKTLWLLEMPITDGPHETPILYDEGIPFISAEAVSCGRGRIDFSHKRGYISKEYYDECCKKYTPRLHDIYMIKSGATTGRVSMVDTEEVFTIWSPLAVLRANQEKMLPRFLFYSLQADYYQKQISLSWSFGTQQNIGMRVLEQLKIATPDADGQQEIATYLDIKCAEIDRIIEKKEQLIEELGSYKKSLIYEYVTGKKEVTA